MVGAAPIGLNRPVMGGTEDDRQSAAQRLLRDNVL
jgi:hypothetical protein